MALPLEEINAASAREKSIRHGHPSTLHLWWARRPLAACRAVLFAQLVDDPSAHPEQFPTEEAQEKERERLFDIIRELVKWENTNNEKVLKQAHAEILKSCDGKPPAVYDPFSGGGSIPLEAQRLGLEAYGSDLNPVAVMIGKALIEIPPKFAGMPPINPEYRATHDVEKELTKGLWTGAKGLAEDVRYYGKWMRDRAFEKIGHLYPPVELPDGSKATVIAWLWARTVESPNPALNGVHVPLVKSFLLSTKKGKEAWVEPIISKDEKSYSFDVHMTATPVDKLKKLKSGTKTSRGANFSCLLSGTPITPEYIKAAGKAGKMDSKLMAVVIEGEIGRSYVSPTSKMENIAYIDMPNWIPSQELPNDPRNFWTPPYGLSTYSSLFTSRQLTILGTFLNLISEAREEIYQYFIKIDCLNNGQYSQNSQRSISAYANAIILYLAFSLDKFSDYSSALCSWHSGRETIRNTFGRQAVPMVWDYAEVNPFSKSSGNFMACVDWVWKVISRIPANSNGCVFYRNALQRAEIIENLIEDEKEVVFSSDPPYYDNISYSDLSDFFYIWLRQSLKNIYPEEFSTLITPKEAELIASPYRQGTKDKAEKFFAKGMTVALKNIREDHASGYPVSIFYAFKQSESNDGGTSSTGWETFLEAVIQSGLTINGTWPVRTELGNRMISHKTNALASSIVLVCRKQIQKRSITTRGDFVKALRRELPVALRTLQHSNIAPVDLAQASIGPGPSSPATAKLWRPTVPL